MTLVVDNISKKYGDTQVLDRVSFKVMRGEIVGLLGENGVGKTTLLKILANITPEYTGAVTLDANAVDIKRRVGYMSERNPLYPDMYIKEYLEWIARSHGAYDAESISQVVDRTGLSSMLHKKIGDLSKGYRQRVGLAAAIVHDPVLLILDEPINGLDPAQIIQYRALIRSLAADKMIILSSHLMQEIEALCSRYILLENGRIAQDQSLTNKEDQYHTLRLKVNDIVLGHSVADMDGIISCVAVGQGIYDLTIDQSKNSLKTLQQHILESGGYIDYLVPQRQGLDHLFTKSDDS